MQSANGPVLISNLASVGKLAATLAPAEPQLQHAALRLTRTRLGDLGPCRRQTTRELSWARLHSHMAAVEHSDGRVAKVALTPNRSEGSVARELLGEVARRKGSGQTSRAGIPR